MRAVVSISKDMTKLRKFFKDHDKDEKLQGKIKGRGGVRKIYSADGKMSVCCITGIEGLEDVADLDYITLTSYEEIFGYTRQAKIDGVLQFGPELTVVEPKHTIQVVVGYEDGDPIPVMEAVYEDWERVFNDMDGNEVRIPEKRLVGYQETGEFDGFYSEEVFGDKVIPKYTYMKPNPILEDIPPIAAMRTLYNKVYPQKEVTLQGENGSYKYKPPPLMSIPAGWPMDHLNI